MPASVVAPRKLAVAADSGSLAEVAYGRIREAITTGELKPGAALRETAVAEWLAMSRTPVRDALRRLESDGLLVHEAHRGAVIATLDQPAILELYAMREVLEGSAAALAARNARDDEIDTLRHIVQAESAVLDDPEGLVEINRRFHLAIFRAAHNRYLLKMLNPVHDAIALMGRTTLADPPRAREAHEQHLEIVALIAARDAARAEDAARRHSRGSLASRLKLMRDAA
jgi:DNA-binding GntR family transcriptional regulator